MALCNGILTHLLIPPQLVNDKNIFTEIIEKINNKESLCTFNNKLNELNELNKFNESDEQKDNFSKWEIFEHISNNLDTYRSFRDCRFMDIPQSINKIKPGQYCIIPVEGGGYFTEWYYYNTLDGRHMLIFETINPTVKYTCKEIYKRPEYIDNIYPKMSENDFELLNPNFSNII